MARAKGLMSAGQSGKLGNVVFMKGQNGQTYTREYVTPKNPNTLAQRYQRVIVKTVNKNYQKFKDLADHAFEGKTMGAQCMNRFMQLNTRSIRSRAVELQQAGQSLSQFYSFMPLKSEHFTPASVFISEGSLPMVPAYIEENYALFNVEENTYQSVIDKYGLRRGDQLTFVCVVKDALTEENVVRYARVILDPRNPDGSGAAMSSAFIGDNGINLPSYRNAGVFTQLEWGSHDVLFNTGNGNVIAAGIIVSRKDDKKYWYRSTCKLTIAEDAMSDKVSLEEAAAEIGGDLEVENSAYLNNAGEGGSQGSETVVEPTPNVVQLSPNASINGVSQSISGGSVTVTAPLTTVELTGTNLEDADAYIDIDGTGTTHPTTKTATSLSWTGLNVAAGHVATVHVNGNTIVAITAQAAQGGGGSGQN
ncbi:MAG: hypothetical protein IJ826_02175 [Bacteroidaceae bacterium]|nr:hypothetical protein [Prevotella sp.]MBR1901767.1 hypothetical protein [Bacteroidaceae bacterium]